MHDVLRHGVMLDRLNKGEALGTRIVRHGQVHEDVFRGRVKNEILKILVLDFKVLRLGLTPIDGGGHTPTRSQLFHAGAPDSGARICR